MTHKNENIHALGNGRIGAYECGPDIIQVFGPPYSAPTLGSLVTESGGSEWVSSREPGAAIWIHTSPFGLLHDFVASSDPVLVRKIDASAPLNFTLQLNPASRVSFFPNASHLTCEIPAGVFFYPPYPYPRPVFYRLAWEGEVQPRRTDEHTFCFECLPGHSRLFICGGPEYPQAVENLEAAQSTGVADLLAGTRAAWQAYATAHAVWQDRLPAALPQRSRLLQAIDDVAVLIRAQQSSEGGVLAGHNYHLCYVRDQYGVSRGLLALGHTAEAQAILEYYWQIWQRHGRICNAQAAGVDGVFHIHENDEVEITGYLIRQAFDLQQAGVEGVVERVFPMLTWAWEAQKKHLISNMLPFNGDETYVAGGILPRTALNDGSAEATLLFLDSGEKLLSWAESRRCWNADRLSTERSLLAQVRAAYRPNFWHDGRLWTNNPTRAAHITSQPRFRHGVCERCHSEGRMSAIGWTERSASGRFLCPHCLAENHYIPAEPRTFELQSVCLTPFYFHSNLFSLEELRPAVDAIWAAYQQTGALPSRPGDTTELSVGYDYGFFLYALTQLSHPAAPDLYRIILSLADSTGAWVEYYQYHKPRGTRCRPWESAINLEALLSWAERSQAHPGYMTANSLNP